MGGFVFGGGDVADLTAGDREQIKEAADALRRTRQVVDLGMPAIGSFVDQTRNEHRS
ncbi:hypothetical protein ACWCXX_33815 [Streptomyces sp. NPDC001732]